MSGLESSGSGHSRRQWIAEASRLPDWCRLSLRSYHVAESASWSASSRAIASSSTPKLIQAVLLGLVGLVVIAASSRALIALAGALVMPIVVLGIVAALLRCVWWLTGPR